MKAKVILVGGFLGAGKTTVISSLARWLIQRWHRVAIIANEQASGLVDSSFPQAKDFSVEGVPGGCMVCKPDALEQTIQKLDKESRPNIILAEAAASRSDQAATVVSPLLSVYKTAIEFAPFSVVVDPFNMLHILGLEAGRGFAPEIESILRRQLEEAEMIVLNKRDIVPLKERHRLEAAFAKQYPKAKVHAMSARTGEGCETWFDSLLKQRSGSQPVGRRGVMPPPANHLLPAS